MKDYKKLIDALRCKGECHEGCAYRSEEGWCDAEAKMDADAADAIEKLMEYCKELQHSPSYVQNMPKRGEWEKGIHVVECSVCSEKFYFGDETWVEDYDICEDFGWKYCPHCGAKMGVQDG